MDTKAKAAHVWKRDDLDWYVEPERVTEQLCDVERFSGDIIDPCCGSGNIVRSLIRRGYPAMGSDIVRRVPEDTSWFLAERDFLTDRGWFGYPENCVMNPPFFKAKGLEAFIRKALTVFTGKICVFADVKFLAGANRANGLFSEYPPQRIWIITPRPSCPPGDVLAAGGKASGGTSDWCWLVWSHLEPMGPTRLDWIRNGP